MPDTPEAVTGFITVDGPKLYSLHGYIVPANGGELDSHEMHAKCPGGDWIPIGILGPSENTMIAEFRKGVPPEALDLRARSLSRNGDTSAWIYS